MGGKVGCSIGGNMRALILVLVSLLAISGISVTLSRTVSDNRNPIDISVQGVSTLTHNPAVINGYKVRWHYTAYGWVYELEQLSTREVVDFWFPGDSQAWDVLLCEGDSNGDGLPDQDLIDLERFGGLGEATPWQIHPGNFPALGEWPEAGNFWQQTRLARAWWNRIGAWDAPGGWSCA